LVGPSAIAKMLKVNNTLETLDLSINFSNIHLANARLDNSGIIEIAKSLANNSSLLHINLGKLL